MKLNATKTETMIVSRYRTVHPQSPALTIGGTVLKESDLIILGVTFDSKITFEKHIFAWFQEQLLKDLVSPGEYSMIDRSLLQRCFHGFVL